MEILCKFYEISFSCGYKFYSCSIQDKQIPADQEFKLIGPHENGRRNSDVLCVYFSHCTMTKIPKGLTKVFPNLNILTIYNSKLRKICKNDLIEYRNLEKFSCLKNDVEYLPADLFEDCKKLEWIDFWKNKLKIIEPNILDGLDKLRHVNLRENPNFEKCFSIYPEYPSIATLEEIKCELFEKYPECLKELKQSEEKLRNENQQLKESKFNLRMQLHQEKIKVADLQRGFFCDLKAYTQEETTKDFTIQIGFRDFEVHKFLLAARSPTLAELLKNNPEVENLNLVDISVEIFEIILKFLYTDELPDDDETNFLHLFAAAGKLKIEELKNYATIKIFDQLNKENALEVFKLSNKYGHDELRQKAFNELKRGYPGYDFKDKWITETEIVVKIIDQFKKAEEAIRKLEEEFENATFDNVLIL